MRDDRVYEDMTDDRERRLHADSQDDRGRWPDPDIRDIRQEMRYAGMPENRRIWARSRDALVQALESLGFRAELGQAIAGHLGSPRAIDRMTAYLNYEKPKTEELVVDEMLAIRSEIDAWREKKASERANAAYNELLYYGLGTDEEES